MSDDKRPAIDLRTEPALWSVVYPVAAQLLVGRGLTPQGAARLALELYEAVQKAGAEWATEETSKDGDGHGV